MQRCRAYVIYTSGSTGKPKGWWCRSGRSSRLLLGHLVPQSGARGPGRPAVERLVRRRHLRDLGRAAGRRPAGRHRQNHRAPGRGPGRRAGRSSGSAPSSSPPRFSSRSPASGRTPSAGCPSRSSAATAPRRGRCSWPSPRAAAASPTAYGPTECTTFAVVHPVTVGRSRRRVDPDRPGDQQYRDPGARPAGSSWCRWGRSASSTSAATASPSATTGRPATTAAAFVPHPYALAPGRTALPHRRPGAAAAGRRARVRRPGRLPGQAARLPHRAGRDRGGAGPPAGSGRPGGGGARGPARRPPPGRLRAAAAGRRRSTATRCGRRSRPSCPTSWCRPTWWCWACCRSPPTARSTGARCRHPKGGGRKATRASGAGREPLGTVAGAGLGRRFGRFRGILG